MKAILRSLGMLSLLALGLLAARPAVADSVLYSSGAPTVTPDKYMETNECGSPMPAVSASCAGMVESPFTPLRQLHRNRVQYLHGIFNTRRQLDIAGLADLSRHPIRAFAPVPGASGTIVNWVQSPTSYITDDGYTLMEDSGSIAPLTLGSGNYAPVLGNGSSNYGGEIDWIVTDNMSASGTDWSSGMPINKTVFQAIGAASPSSVAVKPEPGSFTLIGTGMLDLAGAFRRKLLA